MIGAVLLADMAKNDIPGGGACGAAARMKSFLESEELGADDARQVRPAGNGDDEYDEHTATEGTAHHFNIRDGLGKYLAITSSRKICGMISTARNASRRCRVCRRNNPPSPIVTPKTISTSMAVNPMIRISALHRWCGPGYPPDGIGPEGMLAGGRLQAGAGFGAVGVRFAEEQHAAKGI
jgi:hypothetical protein